jgi:hypothetical protein
VQIERGRFVTRWRSGPPSATAAARQRNLLSNSGFEQDELDWSLWHRYPGVSAGGVVEGAGRNGSKCFHVVNPGKGGANLHSEPVPCEPDKPYTLSVYVRVKNGAGVQIAGWGLDRDQKVISYGIGKTVSLPRDVNEFTRFSCTFTTPPTCVFLKAHLICDGGEVWWDDCQLERGEQATEYEPGPKVEMMARREGPEAVAYTRAIIREARLRDVLSQTERLALYSEESKGRTAKAKIEDTRGKVDRISELLGAPYLVPDYRATDYAALTGLMDDAEKQLSAICVKMGYNTSNIFQEWQPRLDGPLDKTRLAQEFLIFPCFTRDYFFRGEGNWDILKPYGFRIVSGWWGVGYSPQGELRPEGLDKVLEECQKHGYTCDITIDGAAGAVAALKDRLGEAIYLHNAEGGWSPGGNCHNTVNIWHPEVRVAAAEYLKKLASYYARKPGVISYELTNEPSLTIEEREHGYQYKPKGVGDYSPPGRQAWRDWLRRKYGTVAALNVRWEAAYGTFEEVLPPADLTPPAPKDGKTPVNTGAIYDFQTFRAEGHADWFRWCVDAMHAGDPRKPVISQFVSGPMDRKEAAVDLRMMAEQVPWDFYGTHDWPGAGPAAACLYAVSMNRKAGRPHWEDEFIWSQWERKGTPEPVMRAALERNLWRQIAWGKRGISLFNLESEWLHDSPRNWNNSMLNIEADLEVPRYSTGIIPTVERKTNLFKDILYQTRIAATDVAILRPTAATIITAPDKATRNEGTFIANALLERHEMPIMIPEEHVASDGCGATMLVVPWAINLPQDVERQLLAWVAEGGIIFATGPLGVFDEYGKPSAALLKATVGDLDWRYNAEKGVWEAAPTGPSIPPNVEKRTVSGSNVPLLVAKIGKGRLYLWPDRISVSRKADILEMVLDEVIPVRSVRTDLSNIEIVPRVGASGERYLFVVNLDAKAPRDGEVAVRGKFENVVDLSCEARPRVPVKHAKGVTSIPLHLKAGNAVFLALGKD